MGSSRMLNINNGKFALAGMGAVAVAVGVMASWSDGGTNSSSNTRDPDCLGELAAPGPVEEMQPP